MQREIYRRSQEAAGKVNVRGVEERWGEAINQEDSNACIALYQRGRLVQLAEPQPLQEFTPGPPRGLPRDLEHV